MINVAIVDDEKKERQLLTSYVEQYFSNDKRKFKISLFDRAETLLFNYKPNFDIIFMDIELPGMDGMETSKKLRKLDPVVTLIFVTNMAQFAVKGYEVNAMDFVVKPVSYYDFSLKMKRAEAAINSRKGADIVVAEGYKISRISSKDLYYIEVIGHYLYYHLQDNVLRGYGKISELETQLAPKAFMRCNNCYLINPHYIESVEGFSVKMKNGDELLISRARKKTFMKELTEWLGEGKNL